MKSLVNKRKLTNAGWDAVAGILFCLPFIIGFLVFFVSPLITYVVIAFSKLTLDDFGNIQFISVKWSNFYDALFIREDYIIEVFKSVGDLLILFPSILLFSFFISSLLNQKFRGRTISRVIFFLPVIIASGIAAVVQNDALTDAAVSAVSGVGTNTDGTVNLTETLMKLLGTTVDKSFFSIIEKLVSKIYAIAMSSGVQILIFLAGLQTISPSLYEASAIEGATAWENFWKITLPMISPMILVNAVYTIVDVLGSTSNTLINKIYSISMVDLEYGLSSAMGVIYFGIMFAIVGLVIFVISKLVFYEEA